MTYWAKYEGNTNVTYAKCYECYEHIGRISKEHLDFDGIILCKMCYAKLNKEQQ
jgi:hypothetical protein